MFIFFHLLTGLLIGYLLADRLGTRAVVIPCVLGTLLPDLVDKPLGIFLLGAQFGTGRIYCHTLLFLLVLLALGAVVHHRYRWPAILAVGIGVASHQLLDFMWTQPRTWFYPFLGPFQPIDTEGWLITEILLEIQNPIEWVSGIALLLLFLLPVLWPAGTSALIARHGRAFRTVSLGAVPVLVVYGLYLIATHAPHLYSTLNGWQSPCDVMISGAVLLLMAYAAFRLAVRLRGGAASNGLK